LWCMHRSPRLGAGLTRRPPRPAALLLMRPCLPAGRLSLAKSINKEACPERSEGSFLYCGGEKFIKGVFARFRPPQPPGASHRRNTGGWEAESFLVTEVVTIPHPKQSLCSDFSPSGFCCLRSKPAFPFKIDKRFSANFLLDKLPHIVYYIYR